MTDNDRKFDRDAWVAKIEALLATAESYDKSGDPADGEVAAKYRAKAEKLMNQFRVQEEEFRLASASGAEPVKLEIRLCNWHSPYYAQYQEMFFDAAYHSGCRSVTNAVRNASGEGWDLVGTLVGFEIDTRYAQLLILNASVVFAAHLEPAYDPNESEAENIYRLRRAGKTRREIAVKLWGKEFDRSVPAHGKVQKIYEAECLARGEQPLSGRGVNREVYTELYAKQFVATLYSRLRQARADAGVTSDGGLVLANRKERVDEAFYNFYPEFRPEPSTGKIKEFNDDRTEAQKKRDAERWERQVAKEAEKRNSAAGRAGTSAGHRAAQAVPLRGVTSQGRVGDGS